MPKITATTFMSDSWNNVINHHTIRIMIKGSGRIVTLRPEQKKSIRKYQMMTQNWNLASRGQQELSMEIPKYPQKSLLQDQGDRSWESIRNYKAHLNERKKSGIFLYSEQLDLDSQNALSSFEIQYLIY